ncbi:reverse transcriptase domain-containing protein [Tanacetum coccineum]
MRTRSQSRRRRQQQTPPIVVENFDLEEPIVDQNIVAMADNRTMAQMLQAPIEVYEDAIVVPPINANNFELKQHLINLVQSNKFTEPNETFNEAWERFKGLLRQCPHHGFSELHQLDTFYNSLNTNDQDALDSAAGGNFLDKMPRDGLAIIKSKSKVHYSRSRPNDSRAITNASSSTSSPSHNSFKIQQMAALLEDKMNIRMCRLEKAISEKNATTPATVKSVEEICVTCCSNHKFNNCPLTRNEFPVFHDNIHQFQQTAAVGNFVQRNPPNLANQMRPPGFNQPNVQSNQGNQSRYQGNNFNSNQNRGNNFNQNHQNNQGQVFQPPTNQPPVYQVPPYQAPTPQIQGVSKTDFENYVKANDAVLKNVQNQGQNLQNQMANVTSLLTSLCDNFKNSASTSNSGTLPSQTVTNPRQQINAITTRSGKTLEEPSTPLVPTPVVSNPQKEPEQNPETSTENALVEMLKFNKWLSSLLRNKEKLEEISIRQLNRTSALADSGASINLLPHSIYKKLGLEALTPTRMTLELANRSITHPMGIAEDVVVRVDGRPFLRTAKTLIDLYEETLTLRVGKEELVYYADKSKKNKEKNFVHAISIIDFSKDDPFSWQSNDYSPPSSSPMKTSDNFEKFTDELTPLDSLPPDKVFFFFTLTSPEEVEFEAYLERDSIPPGIDLTLPPALKVSS